jgi:hypothetical protein
MRMAPTKLTSTQGSGDITRSILVLRGQRVLLDAELAALYGVETRTLIQAVQRNRARFPADFMFQLNAAEWLALRSPSSRGHCCPRPSQTRTSVIHACGSSLHSFAHQVV